VLLCGSGLVACDHERLSLSTKVLTHLQQAWEICIHTLNMVSGNDISCGKMNAGERKKGVQYSKE